MLDPHAIRQLLAFYVDAGVNVALTEEPVDHLSVHDSPRSDPQLVSGHKEGSQQPRKDIPTAVRSSPLPPQSRTVPATGAIVAAAQQLAEGASTCEALRQAMDGFDSYGLNTHAPLVFADGNPQARIIFVGDVPRREDEEAARPFAGKIGGLFDRMLAAISLDRSSAYLTNVIPWRPPGSRAPSAAEIEICLPFIRRHIELINPDLMITLGTLSTQVLLSTREATARIHGRWFEYKSGQRLIRALPSFHPSQLLSTPSLKRLAWQDLQVIAQALTSLPSRAD